MEPKKIQLNNPQAEKDAREIKEQVQALRMEIEYVRANAITYLTGDAHVWDDPVARVFSKRVENYLKGLSETADTLEECAGVMERIAKMIQ